ncbi:dienelactone hydrolase [Paenibacillus sp. FSL R7-0273]|uniref:alpha/beta hydrolase family protein n=1 Tax=Paenibacillus sp. FSL R7-0273 TaxID=1536772 RepID=UPI0004F5A507|nr:alpha/beta hydrolase family protein [Paenibacillus sp. FSL R7-0273]AIQ46130.1 dienelactone hydrolase [Paenibacillus sp. FSL R7-0273]OMF92746.1 dienelactone hydrolase [Paenibacillus sp. FSL R7-0273]
MDVLQQYMNKLTDSAPRSSAYQENIPFGQWRSRLAAAFTEKLGGFPEKRAGLEPVLLERVACPGYTRERIEITTFEGLRMPLYLLIPEQAAASPVPAVIAVHGHGYGSREITGLHPDGSERESDPGLHKDFAVSLVKEGFVVAAPEVLGFGDRRLAEDRGSGEPGKNSCFRLSSALLMAGQTMAGYRIYETMRVLDYLLTRSEVHSNRIGIMGISGGGLVAGFTAALDERLACAVVSGYANTFAASILTRNHCLDNYIPGILLEAEMPDLLGLIAPRGLFLESGSADPLFGPEGASLALSRLQEIYSAAGHSGQVRADFFPGGHEIHGGPAFSWLRQQLADLS